MISTLRKTALAAVFLAGTAGFACAQTSLGAGGSVTGGAGAGASTGGASVGTGAGTSSTLGVDADSKKKGGTALGAGASVGTSGSASGTTGLNRADQAAGQHGDKGRDIATQRQDPENDKDKMKSR